MLGEPPVNQRRVIADRHPVPGVEGAQRKCCRSAKAIQILRPRQWTFGIDLRVGGDSGEQVISHESDACRAVDEKRVRGAVSGASNDRQGAPTGTDSVSVVQSDSRLEG